MIKFMFYTLISMLLLTLDGPTPTPTPMQLHVTTTPTRTMRPTTTATATMTPWPFTPTPYPGPVDETSAPYPGIQSGPSEVGIFTMRAESRLVDTLDIILAGLLVVVIAIATIFLWSERRQR